MVIVAKRPPTPPERVTRGTQTTTPQTFDGFSQTKYQDFFYLEEDNDMLIDDGYFDSMSLSFSDMSES